MFCAGTNSTVGTNLDAESTNGTNGTNMDTNGTNGTKGTTLDTNGTNGIINDLGMKLTYGKGSRDQGVPEG